MLEISINDQQREFSISPATIRAAVCPILSEHGYVRGELSIAVVDDVTIHRLNREHLSHDYPTDVLSFVLEREAGFLVGEIIVSADTAIRLSREFAWDAEHELMLYVVHGTLHLVGYGDKTAEEASEMRRQELNYLKRVNIMSQTSIVDSFCTRYDSRNDHVSRDRTVPPAAHGPVGDTSR